MIPLMLRLSLGLVAALLATHHFSASSGTDLTLEQLDVTPMAVVTATPEIATLPQAPVRMVRDFSLNVPKQGVAALPTQVPASLPTRVPASLATEVPTLLPVQTAEPLQAMKAPDRDGCDPAYPDKKTCIPPGPPFDQGCAITSERRFEVLPPDPQSLDADGDGIGCEPIRG